MPLLPFPFALLKAASATTQTFNRPPIEVNAFVVLFRNVFFYCFASVSPFMYNMLAFFVSK